MTEGRKWLDSAIGKDGAMVPPALNSDRTKELLGRALLTLGSLSPEEVQELAASALRHLVMTREALIKADDI